MILIGDVHGKIKEYKSIIKNVEKSIQVGDLGYKEDHEWFLDNIDTSKHKYIPGNHDPKDFHYSSHSLGDYSYYEGIFNIRGAQSHRITNSKKNLNNLPYEELEYSKFSKIIDLYKVIKPRIVVSHECPQIVREEVFKFKDSTKTSNFMNVLLDIHKPRLWVFGHYHRSINKSINGCKFRCLNMLEVLKV